MMDSRKFPTFHVMPEGCLANEDTWRKLVSDGLKDRQAWQNVAKANCSPKSISTVLENMSTPVAKEDGSKQPQPGYQMGYPTTGQRQTPSQISPQQGGQKSGGEGSTGKKNSSRRRRRPNSQALRGAFHDESK